MLFRLPDAAGVIDNPDPDELQELAARMPNARRTAYGNVNVQTKVVNRSKGSTFIVTDEPDGQNQAITREEGESWAERQDEYIADREMVVIDGYIGSDPEFRTPARLYVEGANANIAGMQQQLYFSPADDDHLDPELTVIYTPNLKAEGYPDDRLISVDGNRCVLPLPASETITDDQGSRCPAFRTRGRRPGGGETGRRRAGGRAGPARHDHGPGLRYHRQLGPGRPGCPAGPWRAAGGGRHPHLDDGGGQGATPGHPAHQPAGPSGHRPDHRRGRRGGPRVEPDQGRRRGAVEGEDRRPGQSPGDHHRR